MVAKSRKSSQSWIWRVVLPGYHTISHLVGFSKKRHSFYQVSVPALHFTHIVNNYFTLQVSVLACDIPFTKVFPMIKIHMLLSDPSETWKSNVVSLSTKIHFWIFYLIKNTEVEIIGSPLFTRTKVSWLFFSMFSSWFLNFILCLLLAANQAFNQFICLITPLLFSLSVVGKCRISVVIQFVSTDVYFYEASSVIFTHRWLNLSWHERFYLKLWYIEVLP